MKNKLIFIGGAIIVLTVLISLIVFNYIFDNVGDIKATSINSSAHVDNSNIDWDTYNSYDEIDSREGDVIITEKGVYTLTGEINGKVIINTSGNVKLILNNVIINSDNGPCILVKEAANLVIYTEKDSKNVLNDTTNYNDYLEEDGTIFSHDDLILEGEGTLIINANYGDAIVSKDDLTISSGSYEINSNDDGIKGKDSVHIVDGTITINSKGDGIKATNDTEEDKGNVVIDGGTITIEASLDGIQAEKKIVINGGTFDITTGGGAGNVSTSQSWGMWGNNKSVTDSNSAKGLKAGDNIVINNGTIKLNTSDDAIHSNNYVGIVNGNISITSGDDGIHADKTLVIDNGTINITKSYEGLEASSITINVGNISVTASDDGFNAAGGNDSSSMDRPGANNFESSGNNSLTINGGKVYVNATGDGLDANGSIYINGGEVIVDGPTNNGNGALDYDREFVMKGGSLIAIGSSGMAQGISNNSSICGILINFSSTYNEGTVVSITDSSGNEVVSYTAKKSFSSILVANNILKQGEKYTVKINGSDYTTVTLSSVSTTVGNQGMMGGGPGGRR